MLSYVLILFLVVDQVSKQKVYVFPERLDQLSNLNIVFFHSLVTFNRYLFQLIALVNPNFNCCNSFASSKVDKVTTGS